MKSRIKIDLNSIWLDNFGNSAKVMDIYDLKSQKTEEIKMQYIQIKVTSAYGRGTEVRTMKIESFVRLFKPKNETLNKVKQNLEYLFNISF